MRPGAPAFLLVGPYDPQCGEYTFLAPPLGVWRLAGVLEAAGFPVEVFDPNCLSEPESALAEKLAARRWDVVGFSTTGMTLRFDLSLAHLARRAAPQAVLLAGGMEATFRPDLLFELGPFDLVVLGEGERPLLEVGDRLAQGWPLQGIAGTAFLDKRGALHRLSRAVLGRDELRDAIYKTPYERMPYRAYWERLEQAYRVGQLPFKADREARLAEVRSVRLITLNYCPMGCAFCSSTNFLHAAQGSTARVGRLEAEECLDMIRRIVSAFPDVRTIIFQDDIFVFTSDQRILPLCQEILRAKAKGDLPDELGFISTNRIDSMTGERLTAMRAAGFRVLGFGVENFSLDVLGEFNKAQIHSRIAPVLSEALRLGIVPFLDLILTSPRSSLENLAENLRTAYGWVLAGCEVGMYPYVIPFSGAAMAEDPENAPYTVATRHQIAGTDISWEQPAKILPRDEKVRSAILRIESGFSQTLALVQEFVPHVPSRVRSLLWILSSIPILSQAGLLMPSVEEVAASLARIVPVLPRERQALVERLEERAGRPAPSGPALSGEGLPLPA